MARKGHTFAVALSATTLAFGGALSAETLQTLRFGLHGTSGLIDMPTAEVAPDGQLSLTYGRAGPTTRTTLSFQVSPRLQASMSYDGVKDLNGAGDSYWSQSFSLSYRLVDEGTYRPAVSVGLRDFAGTDVMSGEYLVATKSVGDKLRVTAGLGWGRLGSYKPTDLSFGTRPSATPATGGTPNADQWFRGDAAVFGGVSYAVSDRMTVLAEYSSDAYTRETGAGIYDHKSPFNFGVNYKLGKKDRVSIGASYLNGSTLGFHITGTINPTQPAIRGGIESAPLPVRVRPTPAQDPLGWSGKWIEDGTDAPGIRKVLAEALEKEGLVLEAMSLTATRAEIRFANTRYAARSQALGRAARMMSRAFPPSVETFVLTETVNGVPTHSTIIQRKALESNEFEPAGVMLDSVRFADPKAYGQDGLVAVDGVYPTFRWSIAPYLSTTILDTSSPISIDAGLRGRIDYRLAPGVRIQGSTALKLVGDVADGASTTPATGSLPQVRSDAADYGNRVQLETLTATWYGHPAENLFSRISAGYLERMYGGVSGELLWKPATSRFALGAELNYAVKRASDSLFGFEDYDVVTGHVSAYYDFGNGFHGQLDAGRYLAGDWGTTLTVDREFNNGWRVGAYATLTDVSFADFGDGSFDKGIRVTLPTDWFMGTPTTETNNVVLQSLTGDGGAKLNVDGRLYEQIRGTQAPEIEDRWGRFWR